MQNSKQTYYDIMTALWKMFREDIAHAGADNDDKTWLALVGKYDSVYQTYRGTPYEHYAAEMILAHVHELEAIWRRDFFEGIKAE